MCETAGPGLLESSDIFSVPPASGLCTVLLDLLARFKEAGLIVCKRARSNPSAGHMQCSAAGAGAVPSETHCSSDFCFRISSALAGFYPLTSTPCEIFPAVTKSSRDRSSHFGLNITSSFSISTRARVAVWLAWRCTPTMGHGANKGAKNPNKVADDPNQGIRKRVLIVRLRLQIILIRSP